MRKLLSIIIAFILISNNGHAQNTVKIGNQIWMNEDLKVMCFKNGNLISEARDNIEWSEMCKMETPCYRRLSNGAFIYNGYALADKRGLAPDGFRIATLKDFKLLFGFIGGLTNIKNTGKLTSYSFTAEDEAPNGNLIDIKVAGKNIYGFNARMGGFCYGVNNEGNADKGACNFWWTSTENFINDEETKQEVPNLWGVSIGSCSNDLGGETSYSLDYGFSIRCIKIK
ncbi:hypothetical protein DBR32_03345 [Taibaiella sp. KBW10]|uniref:FISUMP domain-containing protein n=1 Tax=Taibaiella sp. KBW10 TaxID=2153357 RepID=UPI000F5A4546|nr:fibrobacter succinogenes major paralogous domain-containing protein [Taibaiella sp. KBW10]RQO32641.1 hypothetical protein DBR32_03345 [Taibaiella sp. KBW10]